MSQQIPTSEVLNLAADLIQSKGWVQGARGWDPNFDGLCLEGALVAAAGLPLKNYGGYLMPHIEDQIDCPAFKAVDQYLGKTPHRWNDEKGRTASEVIEVLRATAVIEAARESESAEVSA